MVSKKQKSKPVGKSIRGDGLTSKVKPKTTVKKKRKGQGRKATTTREINWKAQIEKLTSWAQEKEGCQVSFSSEDDQVDVGSLEITISTKHTPEVALYFFLHELGHVVLIRDKKQYKHAYGTIFENFSANSLTTKVTTLQEELDAWREGLKIAKSLKLRIDRRKFEIIKTQAINSYLAWCSG